MEITGCYGKTIYRNEKTGKTCFTFNTKDLRPSKISCVGVCQIYSTDMPLKLTGELGEDGKFYFTDCVPSIDSKEKMIGFLSGEKFKGIGEKTAERLYDFVGGDIFNFVRNSNAEEELSQEFSAKVAKEIVTKIRQFEGASRIYKYIEPFGGGMNNAIKIADTSDFDGFIFDVYNVGRKAGLSFGCCDSIARSLGVSPFDRKRMDALLDEAMKFVTNAGHSYSDIHEITKCINSICKSSAFSHDIPAPYILSFVTEHLKYKIVEDKGEYRYYSSFIHKAETSIANSVVRLTQSSVKLPFDEKMVEKIENDCGIKYADSQKQSFNMLKTSGIKILTGGPGTGKSTVIKGIIQAIKRMFPDEQPLLCAPTGRSAQRLKEVTGEDSFTIHKALNVLPYANGAISTQPITSRFVIVDEASMIDVGLLDMLLKALSPSAFILFCGDTNQLPSVGPGNVLQDMIRSEKIEVTTLDVVFRQLENSPINFNAHQIISGKTAIKVGKEFHYFSFETEEEVVEKIGEIAKEKYDEEDLFSFQVLTPTKDGLAGTRHLNKVLQPICNKKNDEDESGVYRFKKYDKIIMTRNNYTEGYLNGDIGIIKEVLEESIVVSLGDGKDIKIKRSDLEDISPAYALTVHKSQGSEFSVVAIILPEEPSCLLQRNLLYTAVTRAKKEVYIISQKQAYPKAVNNTKLTERRTSLKEKIERGTFVYDTNYSIIS